MQNHHLNIAQLQERYQDFLSLDEHLKSYIFPSANSHDQDLFLLILFAIEHDASDLHISTSSSGACVVNIECGQIMYKYPLTMGPKVIKEKFIGLLGIPADFSYQSAISSSFAIELLPSWANYLKLPVLPTEPVYQIGVRVQITKTSGRDGVGIVLRFLDAHKLKTLEDSFESASSLRLLKDRTNIQKTGGLVLMSGPTGSGKSSTLYMLINRLNDGANAIFTAEKPVEYRLGGDGPIYQTEVTPSFTFAQAIRSALRMRPKVILVGEINDVDTALAALEAANTGHLVFATIHANTAIETPTRFINLLTDSGMSFERARQLSVEVLRLVIAQRLVTDYGLHSPADVANHTYIANTTATVNTCAPTAAQAVWMLKNNLPLLPKVLDIHRLAKDGHDTVIGAQGAIIIPEIIDFTFEVKEAFCAGAKAIDSQAVYRALSEQYTFEPLAQSVYKYLEQGRVDINEAMLACGHNFFANTTPTWAKRLNSELAIAFAQASKLIDAYDEYLHVSSSSQLQADKVDLLQWATHTASEKVSCDVC